MSYEVVLRRRADRQLTKLPERVYERILRAILALEEAPRPPGSRKLRGREEEWRVRVGDYRVIYGVDDERGMVVVLNIAHRRESYR